MNALRRPLSLESAYNTRVLALAALLACTIARAVPAQEIAITFDDLPSHATLPTGETRVGVALAILRALHDAGAPQVYGFINGLESSRDSTAAPVLRLWREAGYPLGNHTWSHMRLDDNTVDAWTGDVARNETLLAELMPGGDWRWLRYPYLAEGGTPNQRATARNYLSAHRYRIASVTMSFDDWAYSDTYARCMAAGNTAAVTDLERRWMHAADSSLQYYHRLSRQLYNRDIPYVLLMHVGAFSARMLPRLLTFYRERGVRLVTLDAAEADPFYRDDVNSAASAEPATLENVMRARGLAVPPKGWNSGDLAQICR